MRERRTRWGALAIAGGALLLAGCPAEVFYTQLLPAPHPLTARRPEDVKVLVVSPPAAPHVNIGLLEVTSGIDANSSDAMVARLRAEAAARGCDAVVVTGIENQAAKDTRPSVQGSCVVYDLPPPYAPPIAGAPQPAGAAAEAPAAVPVPASPSETVPAPAPAAPPPVLGRP